MKKLRPSPYIIIIVVFLFFIGLITYKVFFVKKGAPVSQISQAHIDEITKSPDTLRSYTTNETTSIFDIYVRDGDEKVAKSLLQYLISIGNYDSGYQLLGEIKKKGSLETIYQPTVGFVIFNYAIQNGLRWSDIDYEKRGINGDVKEFHDSLTHLLKSDFTGFNTSLLELEKKNVLYKNLISSLLGSKKNFSMLKDPPVYYEAGLIAATLMDAGYMPLAGLIASSIIRIDKKYILSYEVLSQIAIRQKDYEGSIKYLTILFSLDTQHLSRTAFFLGKSYFRKGDYSNALLYLNQVNDNQYLYDAMRYMILTYKEQKNIDKMMNGFRYLLIENKLTANDYLLLYDTVFFEPYTKKDTNNDIIATYGLKIIIPYLYSCKKNIASTSEFVCKYGEAGRHLSQNKHEKALNDLLYLTKTYPHPTVYKALGDYYTRQGDTKKAEQYFIKSLLTSADTYENPLIFSGNSTLK